MKKYVIFLASLILFIFCIGYSIHTTRLISDAGGTVQSDAMNNGYILNKEVTKKNHLDAKLIGFDIVDKEGNAYTEDELPFQWLVWRRDKEYGFEHIDKTYDEYKKKVNIEGYVLYNHNEKMYLAVYVERTRPSRCEREYFLRLHYKVWGIDKYEILGFVKM